jgi:hypothetical protein
MLNQCLDLHAIQLNKIFDLHCIRLHLRHWLKHTICRSLSYVSKFHALLIYLSREQSLHLCISSNFISQVLQILYPFTKHMHAYGMVFHLSDGYIYMFTKQVLLIIMMVNDKC